MGAEADKGATRKIHTGALSIHADPSDHTRVIVDYINLGDDVAGLILSVSQKLKNREEVIVKLETDKSVEKHKVVLSD